MAGYSFFCTGNYQYIGSCDCYIYFLGTVHRLVLVSVIPCASGSWACFGNNGIEIHEKEAGYHGDSIMFDSIVDIYALRHIFSCSCWDVLELASTGRRE